MSNPDSRCAAAPDTGLLLVGHGSREAAGVDEFLATARLVAARAAPWIVEPCFLEFAAPSIVAGFERLAARGVHRVVVAPLMLFAAAHIRRDIPAAVAAAAADHPELPWSQAEHLGCHPAIVELSHARYREAASPADDVPDEQTVLVLVGRGSHDAQATEEMLDFAQARTHRLPGMRVEVGFVAMADPPLERVLKRVAAERPARVVVQPHLLFGGVLLTRIADTVARWAGQEPQTRWISAPHLGVAVSVAEAVVDRACEALIGGGQRTAPGAITR